MQERTWRRVAEKEMDESFDWLRRELDSNVYSGAVAGFVEVVIAL